jgi:hypothetical protein
LGETGDDNVDPEKELEERKGEDDENQREVEAVLIGCGPPRAFRTSAKAVITRRPGPIFACCCTCAGWLCECCKG